MFFNFLFLVFGAVAALTLAGFGAFFLVWVWCQMDRVDAGGEGWYR